MARHRLLLSVATAAVILALPPIQAQAPFQPSHENRYPFTNWSTFASPKWSKFTPPLTVFSWYQSNATGEGFTRAVLGRYRSYLSDRGLSAASIILALAARRKLASAAASNGGRGGLRSVGYAEQCRLAIQKTEIWTTTATRAHCPVAPKKNGRIFFQHLENVSRRAAASGAWFDAGDWARGA